ncbi:MAG: DUF2339 domain-containing protein, partial [Myxococcales bacterium]|nr:DUF2339 domain-containing protein [Myxococcales bacterium]
MTPPGFTGSADGGGDPIRLLAVGGGVALLIGLAIFVGFVIEQGWLTPMIRFVLGVLASAGLTAAAIPLARRGHESVAGALGGAGLGGWFAAWLLARHGHELVSAPAAFVALAAGAAACMLIADRLRLRLMAILATVAACATPVLVTAHGERLHELMLYQLVVIAAVLVLDLRRRWAELPTIALMATWVLGARWAAEHLHDQGGTNLGFALWAGALLLASAASAWRWLLAPVLSEQVEQGGATAEELEVERGHAVFRLLFAGVGCWLASAWAFGPLSPDMGGATLLLAAWHLGLGAVLHARRPANEAEQAGAFVGRGFVILGWLQAMVAGPLLVVAGVPLSFLGNSLWRDNCGPTSSTRECADGTVGSVGLHTLAGVGYGLGIGFTAMGARKHAAYSVFSGNDPEPSGFVVGGAVLLPLGLIGMGMTRLFFWLPTPDCLDYACVQRYQNYSTISVASGAVIASA